AAASGTDRRLRVMAESERRDAESGSRNRYLFNWTRLSNGPDRHERRHAEQEPRSGRALPARGRESNEIRAQPLRRSGGIFAEIYGSPFYARSDKAYPSGRRIVDPRSANRDAWSR